MAKAISRLGSLQPFLRATEGSPLKKVIAQRPETLGAIIWPYECHALDVKSRLEKIVDHYQLIENKFPTLDFHVDGALKLVDLGDLYEDLHIVLDRPLWFMREGQFVLNLFLKDVRIFSLAFSLECEAHKVVVYVGAIQGRDIDGILDIYKKITKGLHGMRPTDFLIELLRVFCRTIGVDAIYAVTNAGRIHQSKYFGKIQHRAKSALNYNRTWLERGGTLKSTDYFIIGVEPQSRKIEEIPPRKRSMYRKRYELLETIERRMRDSYALLESDQARFLEYPFSSR